uniref:Reverse transcriptase domain-containing protein n=1 Tax=Fagus sylvatica TaxID=28930 RepID=A0A2N9EX83_FAGSY
MEEITRMCDSMSLTAKEGGRVDLSDSQEVLGSLLAAKFLTKRVVNLEAVMRTLKPLWRSVHGFTGRDMGSNRVLFLFTDTADMERVLANGPWSFDKYLILLKRLEDDRSFSDVVFDSCSFWVQIHDLPVRCMTSGVCGKIGKTLGQVEQVEEFHEGRGGGNFMRISHDDRDCALWLNSRGHMTSVHQEYGPWLRGEIPRFLRREGSGHGAHARDFSFPEKRREESPVRCSEVAVQDKINMENPEISPSPKTVTEKVDFQAKLQEIDRELGLDHGELNESLELLMQGDSQFKFPTPQAGVLNFADTRAGLAKGEPTGENIKKPIVDLCGPQGSNRKLTGSTWKRITRITNGPLNMAIQSGSPKQKRSQNVLLEEEVVRSLKKKKASGDSSAINEVEISAEDPLALFLSETKLDEKRLEVLRCHWGFVGKFVVPSRGQSGGLALFWRREISVSISSYSHHHIDALMDYDGEPTWRFTGFYGSPTAAGKSVGWDLLRVLRSHHTLPWFCGGDFNELLQAEEKWGRVARPEHQMREFRRVVDDCGFVDLGFVGSPYTWWNKQTGTARVLERLDRCLATADWLLKFPNCRVTHLQAVFSDHQPLWVELHWSGRNLRPCRKRFRFEEMWTLHSGCEDTIKKAWESRQSGSLMFQKLNGELADLHAKEERMWKQRSRSLWLQSGDRNTKFFHCQATYRKRRNHIHGIRDRVGVWQSGAEEVEHTIVEYYKDLFTTSQPGNFDEILSGVDRMITIDMNQQLDAEFTAAEVEHALNQMGPLKAPGPDGMAPIFYQKYWNIVGHDVTASILSCLRDGSLLKKINHTHICLIPKVQNPESVKDFRPISLCNVIYKIIAKVLANRLKKILPHIISESQSAFVPGRLISDNILIAFETLHHMKHMKGNKQGYMALKLDMSKAYDRVEWAFLERIMLTMGFSESWVSMIMECVRTVSYSVLINGEPKGFFCPTRGLRQGDPISPYLFLLCAEGLNALLAKATLSKKIQGISISRGGPKLSHLFFADDSVLFCRASLQECHAIQDILRTYERASGQQINQDKTTLFFSSSTREETQNEIKDALRLPVIRQYENYLGLPSMVGRAKYKSFTQLKDRVWNKIQGWKGKLLSQAGREVLIKAVVQAIPAYTMNVFKLPKKLCADLERMVRDFWWGHSGEARKVHWVNWGALCKPKQVGGMGFRELSKFNDALLAKQVWRLIHNKSSLLYRVLQAKYFPRSSIMDIRCSTKASFAWRSILKTRSVIQKGARWRIGRGDSVCIWRDKWLPSPSPGLPLSPPNLLDAEACVSSLIQQSSVVWSREKNGLYSVRSAYKMLIEAESSPQQSCSDMGEWKKFWKRVWSVRVPHKVRHFLWRACSNALPTMVNLSRRHIVTDDKCGFCLGAEEDVLHAVWGCPSLTELWGHHGLARKIFRHHHTSILDVLSHIFDCGSGVLVAEMAFMFWCVWQRRNKAMYQSIVDPLESIFPLVQRLSSEYHLANEEAAPHTPPIPVSWRPSNVCEFKVNFDAAVFPKHHSNGVGVVIRNGQGLPVVVACQRFSCVYDISDAEAMAARVALQLAWDSGLRNVEVEGDSLVVIRALKDQARCLASYGEIIMDIQLLAASFHCVNYCHVRRTGNNAAHVLARKVLDLHSEFLVWLEDVPDFLDHVIQAELPQF